EREWGGPEVPVFVPLASGSLELFVLDRGTEDVALYRDPYDAGSCSLSGDANCDYEVKVFRCGELAASVALGPLLSRKDELEVQDIRYADGVLYFNEACQSYSRLAGGRCSSMVAVDVQSGQVLWRSEPLRSNNVFLVVGDYLVTGYGFTGE